ncbi:DUF4421 domain-containing protein [Flavihumibacter rivuli]|uniref:DUF4421 family protein n=1 Tax=Flavihumibacter rivuli TaxID=2838156 RepID=UPI001BDEB26B|nr:DUF4421 family protein [Flavihumibacter rivuli]ULQ55981.1 DUF4421 domain-containing protein [Flavihumibacter rivuli]
MPRPALTISLCLAISLVSLCTLAQPAVTDTASRSHRLGKIEYMSHYIILKLSQNTDLETFAVKSNQQDINLSPNANSVTRLSVNYRWLSFSYGFIAKFLPGNDDDAIRGKTKGKSFGLNMNFKRWLQEFSYSRTQGYYLENTKDFDPGWQEGDPYLQAPELVYKNFQGITAYKFNPDFSINALATQTERQTQSAGSFIPQLLYRYYITDNKVELGPGGSSQRAQNLELVLGAGYYHSFVLKEKFYLAAGLTPGIGYVHTWLTTRFYDEDSQQSAQDNFIFRLDGRAGIGYNGRRLFAGLYGRLSAASFKQQNTTVITENARSSVQLFLGYRLHSPKWLKEEVDKAEKLMPIK